MAKVGNHTPGVIGLGLVVARARDDRLQQVGLFFGERQHEIDLGRLAKAGDGSGDVGEVFAGDLVLANQRDERLGGARVAGGLERESKRPGLAVEHRLPRSQRRQPVVAQFARGEPRGVVEPRIAVVPPGSHGDVGRREGAGFAQRVHRLQPNAGMLILGGLGVQFERLGDTIAPVEKHAHRAGPGPGLRRVQHRAEQRLVGRVQRAVKPECLEPVMFKIGVDN